MRAEASELRGVKAVFARYGAAFALLAALTKRDRPMLAVGAAGLLSFNHSTSKILGMLARHPEASGEARWLSRRPA
jgi:hypothetical protein